MTRQEEIQTWEKWKQTGKGEYLTDLMHSLNPLLSSQVRKFSGSNLPQSALESEAQSLAVKALRTYDPTKGAALGTHVTNELRHINRYVAEYQNIGRIPEARVLAISKFNNVKSHLEQELGREANVHELADALSWSPQEVERMQRELRKDLTDPEGKDGFFNLVFHTTDRDLTAVHFVHFSAPNDEKLLLEYLFGIGGKPQITSTRELAQKLGKSENTIRSMQKKLAQKIRETSGRI